MMKRVLSLSALTAVAALALLSCETTAPPTESGPAAAAATGTSPAATGRTGEAIYQAECAHCHSGKNLMMSMLNAKPLEPATLNSLGDDQTRKIILGGGAAVGRGHAMPPFEGRLDAAELDRLLAFLARG